jgi:maltooligosyltrehalose trehalohydrolase
VSDGRRREFAAFGWAPDDVPDPQAPETFERSKLDWAELADPAHVELLGWYRSLIAMRKARPELGDGRMDRVRVEVDERAGRLTLGRGATTVVVDLGAEPASVVIDQAG